MIEEEEEAPRDLLLVCADLKFSLVQDNNNTSVKNEILKHIKENCMISFFEGCVDEGLLEKNQVLVDEMNKRSVTELKEIEDEIKKAEDTEGEIEVRNAKIKQAEKITLMKNKDCAVKAWEAIDGVSSGKRIDICFCLLRIALAYDDDKLFKKVNAKVKDLVEKGGDWDRRNRMFVYQALQNIRERNFKSASQLLLRTVPSFTATEVVDYDTFIFYTILVNIINQGRVDLKKKVIDCPQILQVIDKLPHCKELLNSFYNCEYASFFRSLIQVMTNVNDDRYFSVHSNFFLHQYRLAAYDQFLRPYRSVTLKTMSEEFGLSVNFLDADLCSYITEGKLKCAIDSVDGVIATRQYNQRDVEYRDLLKRGDNLVNRLQKLSRTLML